jgi:hypothetical protein
MLLVRRLNQSFAMAADKGEDLHALGHRQLPHFAATIPILALHLLPDSRQATDLFRSISAIPLKLKYQLQEHSAANHRRAVDPLGTCANPSDHRGHGANAVGVNLADD